MQVASFAWQLIPLFLLIKFCDTSLPERITWLVQTVLILDS